MKQLLRYTSSLLRTVLLLGALAIINIPTKAQNPVDGMPDAFQTMNPGSIIGDGNYYYIQFYFGSDRGFLADQGNNNLIRTKDYIPFAKNIQWTLESTGTANQFKLKSRNGNWAYLDGGSYKCTNVATTASTFTFYNHQGGGYEIGTTANTDKAMVGNDNKGPWIDVYDGAHSNHGYARCCLRIAKLKDNIAHIIYYQNPIYDGNNNVVDGNAPLRGGIDGFRLRHYLTNSGSGPINDAYFRQSDVSSRTTVLRTYDSWGLPTAAAYHKDGLWTLEEAGSDGQFYIKKYGTSDYLNPVQRQGDWFYISDLGTKDVDNGRYVLEDPNANRFTRIKNVQQGPTYENTDLAANMFYYWNGYGADATKTSDTPAYVDFHTNQAITADQAANGYTVVGDGNVSETTYADLTGYSKMIINGTQDMQLRVLMSRQGYGNRPWVEKNVTIGSDGKAEVDLTNLTLNATTTASATVKMTYVNYDEPDRSYGEIATGNTAISGCNKISGGQVGLYNSSWGVNYITYLQVDASAFDGIISRVTLKTEVSGSGDNKRNTKWGVGYNNSEWMSNMTWNSTTDNRSITLLDSEVWTSMSSNYSTTFEEKTFDITDAFINNEGKVVTILVYETEGGGGYIKNPTVEVEYYPTVSYPHLNAIKTVYGSNTGGTISSISLQKEISPASRYLNYGGGDGWQVFQWTGNDDRYWHAGFLPVEVVQSDEYYQVQLVLNGNSSLNIPAETKQSIAFNNVGKSSGMGIDIRSGYTRFTPTGEFQRCFQYENLSTQGFQKLIIKFYRPVKGSWHVSGIVDGGQGWEKIPEGTTIYEMDLTGISSIDDLCIFNWDADESNPIDISEIYFYSGETLGRDGCMTPNSEANPILWKLEQTNDYTQFRLQSSDGRYVQGVCSMTAPNDANAAKVYTNLTLWEDFTLKWVFVNPALKENPVDFYVTHRESYLKKYALQYAALGLDKQGLSTEADSEWKNYTSDIDGFTQKVNHFEITHYLKQGDSKVVEFPTVLNKSNDHIYFQRFYNYNEDDTHMNLNNLKAHVSLDTTDDGDVQYFLYKNGMVTGQKLDWSSVGDGDFQRNVQRHFKFTNSDGQPFAVAVDVSRYSDMTYKNSSNHLQGNLEEPSLTMRYIYYMKDAKEMAANLTACSYGGSKWLESKVFHFPAKQIFYENKKKVGYRGEFIGLRHVFSDYWVFDGNGTGNNNLVSAVNSNSEGKIEVVINDPNNIGIRLGGWNPTLAAANGGNLKFVDNVSQYDATTEADFKGFYFYDRMSNNNKIQYGDSRFVVFRYPASGKIADEKVNKPVYINVYLNNNGTRYQLAQFTVIFDDNSETLPWKSVTGSSNVVQGSPRDPNQLITKAGKPIAKITFDYPDGDTYHYPTSGTTRHNGGDNAAGGTIPNSSPVPLTFGKTNYSFDGDNTNWGSYTMVAGKSTVYGKWQKAEPVNHATYGYNIPADDNFKSAFLYIDASEQPGDICSAPFRGDFCAGDKLMFSGWISGSNAAGESDNRCPGGVTLTVKGEHTVNGELKTETIYRFCPGQCYELDDGEVEGNSYGIAESDRDKYHVVWQQFYFEIIVNEKFDRHWIEVNNNCVSSQGGDFMLDNIEVYAIVPEVIPGVNTPLCVNVDENGNTVSDMRLLKLDVEFNKLVSSAGVNSGTAELGIAFLEKDVFLKTFRTELSKLTTTEKHALGLDDFNFNTISLDDLAKAIETGKLNQIQGHHTAYSTAFDAAILGKKKTWHSDYPVTEEYKNSSVMYFRWNSNYTEMEPYSFAKAVNKTHAVYREEVDGVRYVVMNGNYPELSWKTSTDYYIISTNDPIVTAGNPFDVFNICSDCTKASVFRIDPPYEILGLEKSEDTNDYVVCEGQIPTLVTNLKGFDLNGNEVPMQGLNFDWWLGDFSDANNPVFATIENYHAQKKTVNGVDIKLDKTLSTLRIYYPGVSDLEGIMGHIAVSPNPELTLDMVNYLKELVDAGQLVLHQRSVSVPAEPAGPDDPYFYLVACPIHDEKYEQALNPASNQYVAYFCDEPQGLRIKIGNKAPTLKCGFVPGENGFDSYAYPTDSDPLLSIRLAKKAQFEMVRHGNKTDNPAETYNTTASADKHFLWLPIRDAKVQTSGSTKVIRKSDDYNIYLASTNDPVWDQEISTELSKVNEKNEFIGTLPIVGKIVLLNAINTGVSGNIAQQNSQNRLCIYFTSNFEVREGYSYTLSLPFKEAPGVNTCDGTILINMKIVPDYEVWTGAAGNTDWNNDENWRRADGNPANSGLNQDELYVEHAASTSPLYGYKTNSWNYRTAKDQVFRKGFAPLYCTHVLMKNDEWGNAPVLYDAIDGNVNGLTAKPFPNLRDTSTPILKFDMQARLFDIWTETYTDAPNKGRTGDLLAEMYQLNSCDEIAFQPGTELRNAHLLNYNSAWVEYQLDNNRWYLLGSPLQGTIAGEWYAPSGNAKQETTYYDPVTFNKNKYDRYAPAIYQRGWDKAKTVLYEVGSTYDKDDDKQDSNLGTDDEGIWSGTGNTATWPVEGGGTADEYLDRLGYKPMGGYKANVAIKGIWSNTYNDAQVDYANGGFSVLVRNDLKPNVTGKNDTSGGTSVIRLPKEDTEYEYWDFDQNVHGTNTALSIVRTKDRAKNRGRLKTDLLLPDNTNKTETTVSVYGDQRTYTRVPIKENALKTMLSSVRNHQEPVSAGASNLGYYLVENPFPCGLNMNAFFITNTGLQKKYWILTDSGQQLVQQVDGGDWITQSDNSFASANAVLAPGQGFFVQANTAGEATTITFTKDMQAQSRFGEQGAGEEIEIVVGNKQKMTKIPATYDDDDDPSTPEVPLIIDGVQATVEVPEVDGSGNFVIEEIKDKVTVYKYKQKTGTGYEFPLKTRGEATDCLSGLVITAQRDNYESSALVMQREGASNDFLPEEDTETFITSDLEQVPTVYTLCGRLATTINSIRDFRSLSLGVESNSDAPCLLTFQGVEMLGDSISFYDAVERKLTPLESGMQLTVSGQTQNRYYLVRGLDLEEAATETHLQIFTEGRKVKVIASTEEPIVSVRCFDTAGRQLYSASPQKPEYEFSLPGSGVYIIEAQTEEDRKVKKVMTR